MIRPIHNKADYKKVLARVDLLWGAKQDESLIEAA